MMNRRSGEAAQRFAERRRREDAAQRLQAVVPSLDSLRLEIDERRSGMVQETPHIRRVVVDNAAALFELPCGDPSCKEGGHDLTDAIVAALRRGETRFEVEDGCAGQTGSAPCQRVLRCVGIATYKK